MELEELRRRYIKRNEELNRIISIKDAHIVINVAYEYNIPLNRCRTLPDILSWTFHLTEKSWMTTEVLRHFMVVACAENKLEIPNV